MITQFHVLKDHIDIVSKGDFTHKITNDLNSKETGQSVNSHNAMVDSVSDIISALP